METFDYLVRGAEHRAKDAILSINHANELLFKLLLKENNEYLIFSDIAKYMNAKKKMIEQNKNSVFDIAPGLQTVGFTEAIKRLELLCEINVPDSLKRSLMYLNKKRNEITHYEINMEQGEFDDLMNKLQKSYELTVEFFSRHVDELENLIDEARFEMTADDFFEPDVEAMADEAYIDYLEGAYEDLGEGKW
ncbi:hypothetical protein [Halobacillus karajensis]|uniref:Uncharacterized protein n=1 Tax=Halobacillus karajensis TaxID=195088 RepID=A0A024P3T4_9BACI|nr:hypothetical protein [Halobacillus karajensis]CDQ20866.1 hypothetical protein BN982_03221 [Halobacillus karajensis]CDQ23664.1 hypothetical protein BN983_01915 [Halobacillus karajensis]CDQ27142.1 hypothetical protein BN981_01396 [Halobacillus karajensis]